MVQENIFTKILNKDIPAKLIYEDDKCVAFHDVNAQAPTHFLVIPRWPIPRLQDVKEDDKAILGILFHNISHYLRQFFFLWYGILLKQGIGNAFSKKF